MGRKASTTSDTSETEQSPPKSVSLRADKRYSVTVVRRYRSKERVTAVVDGLDYAKDLVTEATRIRRNRGDVLAVWQAKGLEIVGQHKPAGPMTVAELAAIEVAIIKKRVASSNPRKSGLNKKTGGARSTTGKSKNDVLKAVVKLLGDYRSDELSNVVVQGMVDASAARGDARSSQLLLLRALRRLMGHVGYLDRHRDAPWGGVEPYDPANPRSKRRIEVEDVDDIALLDADDDDESVRLGDDRDPALTFADGVRLASHMRRCGRLVIWLMLFAGLRRGEAMGLELRHVRIRKGRVWIYVLQQRDLRGGEIHRWTKAAASRRRIPLPTILGDLVLEYIAYYHPTYDVKRPDHSIWRRGLIVTSTGRAADGSFMAATPDTWENWWKAAVAEAGLSLEEIRYLLLPHHLRRSFITYAYWARVILEEIDNATLPTKPKKSAGSAAELAWYKTQLHALELREKVVAHNGADVSEYVGQEVKGDRSDTPASPITISYIRKRLGDKGNAVNLAEVINKIIAYEVPNGIDLGAPDENDLAEVISSDDRDWVLVPQAADFLQITDGRVMMALRDGDLEGRKVYFADGDRMPPTGRWAVRRDAVVREMERYESFSALALAEVVRLDRKVVARLEKLELVVRRSTKMAGQPYYLRSEAADVLTTLLQAVIDGARQGPPCRLEVLRVRIIMLMQGDDELRELVPYARRLRQTQVDYWVDLLVSVGQATVAGGLVTIAPSARAADAAIRRVEGVERRTPGPVATGANAARRRKKPRPGSELSPATVSRRLSLRAPGPEAPGESRCSATAG